MPSYVLYNLLCNTQQVNVIHIVDSCVGFRVTFMRNISLQVVAGEKELGVACLILKMDTSTTMIQTTVAMRLIDKLLSPSLFSSFLLVAVICETLFLVV